MCVIKPDFSDSVVRSSKPWVKACHLIDCCLFEVACVHTLLFASKTGSEQTAALHALNQNPSHHHPQRSTSTE